MSHYFPFIDKADQLETAAKEYKDGSVPIAEPRDEAAQIFTGLQSTIRDGWGKDLADLARLTAHQYNGILKMRRFVCLKFSRLGVYIGITLQPCTN